MNPHPHQYTPLKDRQIRIGRVLFDFHYKGCTCSYCDNRHYTRPFADKGISYGLNIPKDKSGWWTIKFLPRKYIRWTFKFFQRRKQQRTREEEEQKKVLSRSW